MRPSVFRLQPVFAAVLLSFGIAGTASAQDDPFGDDDDFVFEDLPEEQAPAEEPDEADDETASKDATEEASPSSAEDDLLGEDDDLVFEDEVTEEGERVEDDLFEDETAGADAAREPGQDTVQGFRDQERAVRGMAPDEEIMAWEAYLEQYPNALYRERIEARIQELLDAQYRAATVGGSLDGDDGSASAGDLKSEEILLVNPVRLPNLNPRTRVIAGAMLGVPVAVQAWADFEYAILRNLSVHGGLWGRSQGWGLEVGVRGSPVKSARSQVLLTPALDLRVNFGPLLFTVRPQLGVGGIVAKRLHLLANVGAEIVAQRNASVGVFGGVHLSARVAQPVAVFVEADVNARRLTRAEGAFVFASVGAGLRFHPTLKNRDDDPLEVTASGYARAASQYIEPFQGAVALQAAFHPDL